MGAASVGDPFLLESPETCKPLMQPFRENGRRASISEGSGSSGSTPTHQKQRSNALWSSKPHCSRSLNSSDFASDLSKRQEELLPSSELEDEERAAAFDAAAANEVEAADADAASELFPSFPPDLCLPPVSNPVLDVVSASERAACGEDPLERSVITYETSTTDAQVEAQAEASWGCKLKTSPRRAAAFTAAHAARSCNDMNGHERQQQHRQEELDTSDSQPDSEELRMVARIQRRQRQSKSSSCRRSSSCGSNSSESSDESKEQLSSQSEQQTSVEQQLESYKKEQAQLVQQMQQQQVLLEQQEAVLQQQQQTLLELRTEKALLEEKILGEEDCCHAKLECLDRIRRGYEAENQLRKQQEHFQQQQKHEDEKHHQVQEQVQRLEFLLSSKQDELQLLQQIFRQQRLRLETTEHDNSLLQEEEQQQVQKGQQEASAMAKELQDLHELVICAEAKASRERLQLEEELRRQRQHFEKIVADKDAQLQK
ncbi:hypothetical protein cyc_04753 [Cyclospora cayetanensis]|uniref:Uncharacterized protein n=1 Tax=Cyclospora cayetanensis TaxID=88456 RepID=A0A1D3CXZ3_9EIME|nr:hypothetical protein cyc_04753 [Cyclospora cayetanensis]